MEKINELLLHYAIIRVDYDKNKSRKQQRMDAVNRINEKLSVLYGKPTEIHFTGILILWNNLPREKYLEECLGYSEEDLIKKFCNNLGRRSNQRHVFIENPLTLSDSKNPDFSQILRRLHLIWKESNNIPSFLEDNFLDNKNIAELIAQRKEEYSLKLKEEMEIATKANKPITGLFIKYNESSAIRSVRKEHEEYYNRFFTSIDNLMQLIGVSEFIPDADSFIDIYFEWQMDKVSVEDCLVKLGDISRASWYRYVNSFEKSPIYEEYTIANNLIRYKKKGSLPDIFEFLKQFKADNKSNQSLTNLYNTKVNVWDCYLKFDEIEALHDVRRVYLACIYKIEIMKHKGIFNKRLEELGLEENDIMIE